VIHASLHGVASGVIGMPEYAWGPSDRLAGRVVDTRLAAWRARTAIWRG
jgi:hypothetical protein